MSGARVTTRTSGAAGVLLLVAACSQKEALPTADGTASVHAAIGRTAPDFTLPSLEGKPVRLEDNRGQIVVLEWFNPGCPFVRKSHDEGSLESMAAQEQKKGVVWLAINSGGPGRQGHELEENRAAVERFGLGHPVLRDEDGRVGRQYDAERTPHVYVIDEAGVLRYRGAIDNTQGGDAEDVERVINYVADALEDVRAHGPVRTPETKAWGCSVKYADAG